MATQGKRLTLVTCLFDLARREGNSQRITVADYLIAGRRNLAHEVDLVAFADPESCDVIASRRRRAGLEARTLVVPLSLEELPAHAELERIAAARLANPLRNGDIDKDTPLYTALMWSKFELARRVIELDPFAATHIGWIDFGLQGLAPDPADRIFSDPPDPVRLLQMRRIDRALLRDRALYAGYLHGLVAAGYIVAERDRFTTLIERFEVLSRSLLDDGFALLDEQLLPLLWAADPDLFEFHRGDYDHILRNYRRPRGSAHNLIFQMREARDAEEYEYSDELGRAAFESFEEGTLEASPQELAELLDECYLAAWHGGSDPEHERAARIAAAYLELAETDPEFRDVFLRHEVRVRSNFGLLEGEVDPA